MKIMIYLQRRETQHGCNGFNWVSLTKTEFLLLPHQPNFYILGSAKMSFLNVDGLKKNLHEVDLAPSLYKL